MTNAEFVDVSCAVDFNVLFGLFNVHTVVVCDEAKLFYADGHFCIDIFGDLCGKVTIINSKEENCGFTGVIVVGRIHWRLWGGFVVHEMSFEHVVLVPLFKF